MGTNPDTSLESPAPGQPASHEGCDADRTVITGPHTALERTLIEEYLASRGHTLRSIDDLPAGEREPMLRAATAAATLKLAEIEARAHLLERLA